MEAPPTSAESKQASPAPSVEQGGPPTASSAKLTVRGGLNQTYLRPDKKQLESTSLSNDSQEMASIFSICVRNGIFHYSNANKLYNPMCIMHECCVALLTNL